MNRFRMPTLLLALLALPALAGAQTQPKPPPPSLTEELVVTMPAGEQTYKVWRFRRPPHSLTQPILYFSAPSGLTPQDDATAKTLANNGSWVVLLDLAELPSQVKDEAGFAQGVAAIADAMKARMSQVIGPRLKGQPERKWPFTFAGRGAGAVRATSAAVSWSRKGKVRGVMMIEPAAETPGIGADAEPITLAGLLPELHVAPVAFVLSGENETVHAIEKDVIGYNAVTPSPEKGLEYISMHYGIRHRRAAPEGPIPYNPAKLFRPGP